MHKQVKTFVTLEKISLQLYSYFVQEDKRGRLFHAISEPEKRVRHALGLNRTTLKRWIKNSSNGAVTARVKKTERTKTENRFF